MKLKCYLLILFIIIFCPMTGYSYNDTKTHREITNISVQISEKSNDYLKNVLGVKNGFEDYIYSKKITYLIQDGATNEDIPYRAYNHFYNPLAGEGLDDSAEGSLLNLIPFSGISTIDWAMGFEVKNGVVKRIDDCGGGNHSSDRYCNDYSWRLARESFYESLTSITDNKKNENFIIFYERLGRILHLIQDMSVPAHTRNDFIGHMDFNQFRKFQFKDPVGSIISWFGNIYEYRVEKKWGFSQTDPKHNIDTVYREASAAGKAIIPLFSRPDKYWDNNVYNGSNPYNTMPVLGEEVAGLAEYTNANFVSIYTMFTDKRTKSDKHYFPYPTTKCMSVLDDLNFRPEEIPAEDGNRYKEITLEKDREGEHVKKFARVTYLAKDLISTDRPVFYKRGFNLNDDDIHDSYASILLPKTIAYTAGLINYFFRGRMEVVPRFSDYDAEKNVFKKVTVAATNESKWINDRVEPMPNGKVDLVIRYKTSKGAEDSYIKSSYRYEEKGDYFNESNKASFDFYLDDSPMPKNASDVRVFLVYHGKLGEEENSVAVGSTEVNFKGSMDIEGRLAETEGSNINGITVVAKNTTGDDETMSGGSVEAVISYRYSPGEYFNVISVETETDISRDSTSIHFDLSNNPLPITATDISISLIYNGKIGGTENAVCVSLPDEMKSDLGISVPEEGVYGLTTEKPQDPSHDGFSKISLLAINRSSGVMNGDIKLAVSYRISQGEPVTSSGNYPETSYDVYNQVYTESSGIDSIPANGSRRLEFDLGENPIPVWATDVYFWLIIKTSGRTHIGFKDVYEPTPIVVSNLGDWTFLNDTPYEVDTFYGLTLALDIVNYDKTGEGYYLVYDPPYEEKSVAAWIVRDAYFRLSSIYNDPLPVEEEGYSFNYPRIAPGYYKKLYILGEETFYFAESSLTWHYPMISIYPDYTNDSGNKLFFSELVCSDDTCSNMRYASPDGIYEYPLTSIKNQTDCPDEATCNYYNMPYPCRLRSVPAATSFRKLDVYHMHSYSHDDHGEYHDYSEIDDELKEQLQ